jgi:DNA primase large subunit
MALSPEFVRDAASPVFLLDSADLCVSYDRPPTLDITLEEFETFAIARLRVLSHIESLSHRSLPYAQLSAAIATYLKQHLPLASNTARNVNTDEERRKDEIGHWVLRLAFCRRYARRLVRRSTDKAVPICGPGSSAQKLHSTGTASRRTTRTSAGHSCKDCSSIGRLWMRGRRLRMSSS